MIIRTRNLIFTLLLLAISAPASFVIAQDQSGSAVVKAGSEQESPQTDPKQSESATAEPKTTKPMPASKEAALKSKNVFCEIEIEDISGEKVSFKKYEGKVVLVVNTASKCGFTGQFKPLQALHKEYHESGLAVVAFPCNQFGKQEPLTEKQIKEFCQEKFGAEFDIFSKINVKGSQQEELFSRLTRLDLKPAGKGDVKWNFEKFLVAKDGTPIARFRSNVSPKDKRIVAKIRGALGLPKLEEGLPKLEQGLPKLEEKEAAKKQKAAQRKKQPGTLKSNLVVPDDPKPSLSTETPDATKQDKKS